MKVVQGYTTKQYTPAHIETETEENRQIDRQTDRDRDRETQREIEEIEKSGTGVMPAWCCIQITQ